VARVSRQSIPNSNALVKEYVLPESVIFTDDASVYAQIGKIEGTHYHHKRISHSQQVYVTGEVHTNTIDGFWSLVKRGIGGVYHSVSAKYLQSYLDEYSFRYNRRDSGNLVFSSILARVGEMSSRKPASEV
jgi:transposase-like protein